MGGPWPEPFLVAKLYENPPGLRPPPLGKGDSLFLRSNQWLYSIIVNKECDMKNRFFSIGIAFLLGLMAFSPILADVYKSTDAQGNTVYTDQPTTDEAQPLPITAPATSPKQAAKPASTAPTTPENTPAATTETKTDPLAGQEGQTAEQCKQYQDNLALLQNNSRRVYVNDDKGNPTYLTPEQRQEQIELTQKKIETFCTPDSEKPGAKP